jgi:hypothetical protein
MKCLYYIFIVFLFFIVNIKADTEECNKSTKIDLVNVNLSFQDKYYFYLDRAGLFSELFILYIRRKTICFSR